MIDDIYVVTAQATLPSGRQDESIGAVTIGGKKGDDKCNALMKAETKAKRRVTLSICGLGMLDETELETIKDAKFGPPKEIPVTTQDIEIGGVGTEASRGMGKGEPVTPAAAETGPGHIVRREAHVATD